MSTAIRAALGESAGIVLAIVAALAAALVRLARRTDPKPRPVRQTRPSGGSLGDVRGFCVADRFMAGGSSRPTLTRGRRARTPAAADPEL